MKRIFFGLLLLLSQLGFGQSTALVNEWWAGGASAKKFTFAGASPTTGARGFRVQYNTTDFSYITTDAAWTDTDTETFKTGSNVIDIFQVLANDNTKALAGVGYYQASNDANDLLVFGGYGPTGTGVDAGFFNRSSLAFQYSTTGASQGVNIDPINSHIISWITTPNRIRKKDFSDATIETLNITTSQAQGMTAYNYFNGDLYLTPETSAGRVERHRSVSGAWALQETLWYTSIDGIAIDFLTNRIVNFPTSGASSAFRYQSFDGFSRISTYNTPLNPGSSFNTEGLVIDPRDGTIWMADPSGYSIHGNITNGNRGWHLDPEAKYLKYINFPHMVTLDKFKHNGVITGQFSNQQIENATSVTFPVINFTGFTNQQNASAWQDMDGTALEGMQWRGSNTAPTTSATTPVACSVAYYDANGTNDGWGSTTPSAWQDTPVTYNYVQARKRTDQTPPVDKITISELIAGLNGKCKMLYLMYDDELMYTYKIDGNKIYTVPNQVNGLSSLSNTSFQPTWVSGSPDYLLDVNANNNVFTSTVSDISSDQSGQVIVYGRRDVTTTRAMYFAVSQSSSNNHQLRFRHNASSDTPASEICIEYVDGTGSVVGRVGVASTSTNFDRIDYVSTGTAWKILLNGVEQTLNVSVGSNNGTWFGDLTAPNRIASGLCYGTANVTGAHRARFIAVLNTEANSTENALIDAFATQEGLKN